MVTLLNEHGCRNENYITTVALGTFLPGIQKTSTLRTVQQVAVDTD